MPDRPVLDVSLLGRNAFAVADAAAGLMRDAGRERQVPEMQWRLSAAGSYEAALSVIGEYVDVRMPEPEPAPRDGDAWIAPGRTVYIVCRWDDGDTNHILMQRVVAVHGRFVVTDVDVHDTTTLDGILAGLADMTRKSGTTTLQVHPVGNAFRSFEEALSACGGDHGS